MYKKAVEVTMKNEGITCFLGKALWATCFLGFMSLTVCAHAVTISGYALGSFNTIVNERGNVLVNSGGSETYEFANNDGSGVAEVFWGTATGRSDGLQNSFVFNGNASDTYSSGSYGSTTLGELFSIGSFDYHNAQTNRDNISAVNFRVDMTIDGFMQMSTGVMGSTYLEFTMSIDNTNDSSNPLASADSVWVSAVNVGMTVPGGSSVLMPYDFTTGMDMMIGGEYYNFMLMGFSTDGGSTFESQAIVLENTTINSEIFAIITPLTTVPVPAAVWLMASGLMGLLGLGYRRKK